jgi:RHS repeat-associated protein
MRDTVDSNGPLRKHVDFDSFGSIENEQYFDESGVAIADPATHSEAVDQLFYYTGQEWDGDARLYNYNARWYDPINGRFLSEDPTGFDAGDPNLYRYVGNSAPNATDPTGRRTVKPTDYLPALKATAPQANRSQINLYSAEAIRYRHEVDAAQAALATARQTLANRSWYEAIDKRADRDLIARLNDQVATTYGLLRVADDNLRNTRRGNLDMIQVYQQGAQAQSVSGAFGSGLKTGGKAVGNAAASSVSLGFYEGPFGVTQQDVYNGYYTSRAIAGVSTEILAGAATGYAGTAARFGSVGKAALAFDTTSNALNVGRGVIDASQNGVNAGNSLQIVGSGLGLGGNVAIGGRALGELGSDASRLRFGFDTATLSSGGLGGIKFYQGPSRPGTLGRADHIADVRGPGLAQATALARPGELVLTEQAVRGFPGINRRPDNQIVGLDGRTRVVIESERRPTGSYHQRRVAQLEAAGIEVQTRRLP